ncbi:MAG: hypothetical protein ACSHYB_16840 [Roseibacillus sp.]
MNENYYTFIGCCNAVEQTFAGDAEVADAVNNLTSVRKALLESGQSGDPDTSLKSALEVHVVTLLEAIEALRASPKYQSLDDKLVELLNNYYNISDSIMGGGGGSSSDGSGSGSDSQYKN